MRFPDHGCYALPLFIFDFIVKSSGFSGVIISDMIHYLITVTYPACVC